MSGTVMADIESLMPQEEDLLYEEELLRNPYSVKMWWRYTQARRDALPKRRYLLYERALKALPGSYKLWYEYLEERLAAVRGLCVTHHSLESLNNTFERALVTMHKMPKIWMIYLQFLMKQYLITRTRRTFDRALAALPVTQHDRIWQLYLDFVTQKDMPLETAKRVYKRYLKLEPMHAEEYVTFLKSKDCWGEAARVLADLVNDDNFRSLEGKSKHQLWLDLCEIITKHPEDIKEVKVEAIIRGGIRKFTDEVSHLWTSLADYFIRQGMFERARDIYEEGLSTVITVHDFGLIFDAFSQFEESLINAQLESNKNLNDDSDDSDDQGNNENFLLEDESNDLDLRIARLEHLMMRRPILLSSVVLRQNPHNVHEWHKRVKLFKGNPTKQILTYTEAVKTVDSDKAIGKPHSLWCAFAKFYEKHEDIPNARVIFEKATQVKFKYVEDLAAVWCEYAEMELRHQNFKNAINVMKRATVQTEATKKRLTKNAFDNLSIQDKLYKNLKVWSFYVDLEESLGDVESTRAVYDRILELHIATPQIILNYALFLQENKYWEDSFRVYERGITLFKFPHSSDIWSAYLHQFVERYKGTKAERARDLFDQVIRQATPETSKQFYLSYANFEETYGLAKHAMVIYDKASKSVPICERMSVYDIYVSKALKFFGVGKVREIYQTAIEAEPPHNLSDEDCKAIYLKFANLEKKLGELDRARALYIHASYLSNPANDKDFWNEWNQFEIRHGNEDTFREMCRIKRSVAASYSQMHFNTANIEAMLTTHEEEEEEEEGEEKDERSDALKEQESLVKNEQPLHFGRFVRGETIQAQDTALKGKKDEANPEEMEIESDNEEEEEKVDMGGKGLAVIEEGEEEPFNISEKVVPDSVFGGLKRKINSEIANTNIGALERFKRHK